MLDYKTRQELPKLQEVLAKLRGDELPVPKRVVYTESEIKSAKTVLERLLANMNKREVSYIRIVREESNE